MLGSPRFSLIGSPSTSMMDAVALAACQQDAQRWGDARIYGAVGWGMAHLPLGLMFDRFGFCVMCRGDQLVWLHKIVMFLWWFVIN